MDDIVLNTALKTHIFIFIIIFNIIFCYPF
nr:MAG TPA: hypothetical protein [Caudoviricetes sp.]